MRVLFERVSEWNARLCGSEGTKLEPMKVVFAERGGHDYDHMFAYFDRLRMQVETGTLPHQSKVPDRARGIFREYGYQF